MILDQAVDRLHALLLERGLHPRRENVVDMVRAHVNATSRSLDITARAALQHVCDLTLVPLADSIARAARDADESAARDSGTTGAVPLSTAAELSTSLMFIATARAHRARPSDTPAITDALRAAGHYQRRIRDAATAEAVEEITVSPEALDHTAALIEAAAHQDGLFTAPTAASEDHARAHLLTDARTARALAEAART
jgi:hypothetical protein